MPRTLPCKKKVVATIKWLVQFTSNLQNDCIAKII